MLPINAKTKHYEKTIAIVSITLMSVMVCRVGLTEFPFCASSDGRLYENQEACDSAVINRNGKPNTISVRKGWMNIGKEQRAPLIPMQTRFAVNRFDLAFLHH